MDFKHNIDLYYIYHDLHEKLTIVADEENLKITDPAERASNPLFLRVDDAYVNAEIKIMIFGQEIHGGNNSLPYGKREDFIVDDVLDQYHGLDMRGIKKSIFSRGFGLLMNKLEDMNKDKYFGVIWNNLVIVH